MLLSLTCRALIFLPLIFRSLIVLPGHLPSRSFSSPMTVLPVPASPIPSPLGILLLSPSLPSLPLPSLRLLFLSLFALSLLYPFSLPLSKLPLVPVSLPSWYPASALLPASHARAQKRYKRSVSPSQTVCMVLPVTWEIGFPVSTRDAMRIPAKRTAAARASRMKTWRLNRSFHSPLLCSLHGLRKCSLVIPQCCSLYRSRYLFLRCRSLARCTRSRVQIPDRMAASTRMPPVRRSLLLRRKPGKS